MKPKIIKGNRIYDNRGSLRFSNNLKFNNIKRFYIVHNYSKNFIRAWHGHLKEEKYITCIKGTFQVSAVKINHYKNPAKTNKIYNYFLNSADNNFLYIPKKYANGSMSLQSNSELLIFSTSTLQESIRDDIRYASDYWNPWKIKHR
tara:strand:- start:214 stop:651 length:438 start_codon:yes stop_codon:yes gene_type:complete